VNVTPTARNGLDGERHVNLSQMRAVDARRISNRQGVLEDQYWPVIEKAIWIELGFGKGFRLPVDRLTQS
jgi:mRNA interferase MazF